MTLRIKKEDNLISEEAFYLEREISDLSARYQSLLEDYKKQPDDFPNILIDVANLTTELEEKKSQLYEIKKVQKLKMIETNS